MTHTQRGSTNRRKATRKVARAHRKIRHARVDFLHRTTTNLVQRADVIAIEELKVAGLTSSARHRRAAGPHRACEVRVESARA